MSGIAHKVEILLIDPSGNLTEDHIRYELDRSRYLFPIVMSIKSKEIEWSDDHPLNKPDTMQLAFNELFD